MDLWNKIYNMATPEADPQVEANLDPDSKNTIEHYTHNSSRAFFWKQLSQYSLMVMSVFIGVSLGGAGAIGMSAAVALTAAAASGAIGLISSVLAHRIELKNEVNIEELYSKRTGQSVAACLKDVAQEKERQADTMLPVMPYQEQMHASGRFQAYDEIHPDAEHPRTSIACNHALAEKLQTMQEYHLT